VSDIATALYEQIIDTPRDLYLRQIYADHLLELGDPRGELISLQLANADPARVASLIAEHGRAWIAPLDTWVKFPVCKFENGFLSEVTLADPAREVTPLIGETVWSTVRALHLGRVGRVKGGPRKILRVVSELIAHPVMRSLTTVTVDDQEGLMLERDRDGALVFVPRFG
jgi:uncharacterized protein (TIGR02996 family)